MSCLQIYRQLLSLATFLGVHSNSKEVSYLSWQNAYLTLKTTCHIKLKFFLWTKLLENLLLAKYLISVAVPLRLIKNEPRYDSKDFWKILHGERGWEELILKIVKSYHDGVASLYISMRNLIKIITFSEEIPEARNSFKNLQNREISWENRRLGGWGRRFPGKVGRNRAHLSIN